MSFWEAQESLTVVQWMLRALVMYIWLLSLSKLMGQREIGKLTIFDFIVSISMGSVTGNPLANPRSSLKGPLVSLATLALLDIGVAFAALKFSRARRVLEGEPVIVIQNGHILEKTMRSARLNLDNLLMGLRKKNIMSPSDVEFAILESDGSISVIPKSQARPLTPADLGIATRYEGLATVLIEDGNILEDNLRENQLNHDWLMRELEMQGVTRIQDIMAAVLDTKGRLFVSRRTNR